jgi:hypothetical protein
MYTTSRSRYDVLAMCVHALVMVDITHSVVSYCHHRQHRARSYSQIGRSGHAGFVQIISAGW